MVVSFCSIWKDMFVYGTSAKKINIVYSHCTSLSHWTGLNCFSKAGGMTQHDNGDFGCVKWNPIPYVHLPRAHSMGNRCCLGRSLCLHWGCADILSVVPLIYTMWRCTHCLVWPVNAEVHLRGFPTVSLCLTSEMFLFFCGSLNVQLRLWNINILV